MVEWGNPVFLKPEKPIELDYELENVNNTIFELREIKELLRQMLVFLEEKEIKKCQK
jgi:hypothetical protein